MADSVGLEIARSGSEPQEDSGHQFTVEEVISLLVHESPDSIEEYNEHLNKLATLVYEEKVSADQSQQLEGKLFELMDQVDRFINHEDPIHSKLYIIVEKNFDIFIKISMNHKNVEVGTQTIRFLTRVVMNLNYWELYNLLNWKPSIYHFLNIIQFDINECYSNFINDYAKYNYKQITQPEPVFRKSSRRSRGSVQVASPDSDVSSVVTNDDDNFSNGSNTPSSMVTTTQSTDDHDKYGSDSTSGLTKEQKKAKAEAKLAAHRVIKKTAASKMSSKSSNYDPDVVHECQLPSPDETNKLCLRRFSRKYELIRHQETVHSKKKKLFKCYVCVKQNPSIGPRIFTRHDTLAKHIRVNHKISGKEAKVEVSYSKKHAEVVEEGDITVHVGRRKTKVDFELRAHMEKKKQSKDGSDDMDDSGMIDYNSDWGMDDVTFD